jgi:hypothetical protein
MTGGWRRLHNEELHNLLSSPITAISSRRMRWAGRIARMRKMRSSYKILIRIPEGKRPLGRPRYKWETIIRMDLTEIWCEGVNWMYLAQDSDQWRAVVNTVMKLLVP